MLTSQNKNERSQVHASTKDNAEKNMQITKVYKQRKKLEQEGETEKQSYRKQRRIGEQSSKVLPRERAWVRLT